MFLFPKGGVQGEVCMKSSTGVALKSFENKETDFNLKSLVSFVVWGHPLRMSAIFLSFTPPYPCLLFP